MQITQLLAVAGLAGSLYAQVNPFVFYPQDPERQALTCTSYVARPYTNRAAEALLEIDPQHFRGVGDANGIVRIFGMYHWLADERLSTPETYSIVIRRASQLGPGPDMANPELIRIANLTAPPSASTGRGTWILSDGFGITGGLVIIPQQQINTMDKLYFGVDLPANPLWPATDGHSLFRADMTNSGTGAVVGENHRDNVPNPTWAGRTTLPSYSTPWTYVLGPLVTSPNLHVGGIDPTSNRLGAIGSNLSMNGLWPDIGGQPRRDGLVVRVTDNLAPFGLAGIGVSVGFQVPFYNLGSSPFGTLIGYSHIGDFTTSPIVLGIGGLQNGALEFSVAPPGSIPPSMVGTDVVFQGIVWDVNILIAEWTNAQAVHL